MRQNTQNGTYISVKVKVMQSRYRPGVAQSGPEWPRVAQIS